MQDAWLRYQTAAPRELESLKAYLTTIVTRLCLDRLKSAHATREQYVGPWLPEPVLTDGPGSPEQLMARYESITMGFLVLLETLTPPERAVFLSADEFLPGRVVDRMLAPWGVGPLVRARIGENGVEAFGARPKPATVEAEDVETLTRLADRIVSVSSDNEPPAEREERLTRIDALSDVLRALSTALDLRDVLDQLSAIARRVLPHDSAFALVFSGSGDCYQIRPHAISVPNGWAVPDTMENPYPAR